MTKAQLKKLDAMMRALQCAEREFMEILAYVRIEGAGATMREQEIASIQEALQVVQMAQVS